MAYYEPPHYLSWLSPDIPTRWVNFLAWEDFWGFGIFNLSSTFQPYLIFFGVLLQYLLNVLHARLSIKSPENRIQAADTFCLSSCQILTSEAQY